MSSILGRTFFFNLLWEEFKVDRLFVDVALHGIRKHMEFIYLHSAKGHKCFWTGASVFLTQDELERLRPLCYRNADVFIVCYSVVRPCSFRNLTNKWVPEIRQHCPGVPLILVGTQLDLREDVQVLIHLAQNQQRPVGTEEGWRLSQELGAVSFAECSALTQKNLKDTFDSAILASFQQTDSNSVQQQSLTLRRKTPDKIKTLTETWWRKINCLMGEQSCEVKWVPKRSSFMFASGFACWLWGQMGEGDHSTGQHNKTQFKDVCLLHFHTLTLQVLCFTVNLLIIIYLINQSINIYLYSTLQQP